jgi:hypothetical protein
VCANFFEIQTLFPIFTIQETTFLFFSQLDSFSFFNNNTLVVFFWLGLWFSFHKKNQVGKRRSFLSERDTKRRDFEERKRERETKNPKIF